MSEMLRVPDKRIIGAELARREHIEFMDFMWQRPDQFIIGSHTEAICEIIDEAIEKYRNGVSSYLAIKCCHRHGKSDIASRYLPANFIGKFPHKEVIVAGYGYSLTRTFSKFCRGVVEDPRFQYVYPGVTVDKKSRALDSWSVGKFGATSWIGVGGSITGKTGDLIILDDFFKNRKEAESEVIRDAVWESVADDIFTRRSPVSIIIILATPWHIDDVFGRIETKSKEIPFFPKFKEIKFPAFKDTYSKGVLFPERFPIEWYQSEKAFLGPYSSAGLMQCEPIARGGNIFQADKIKVFDGDFPEDLRYCRGWDPASTEAERVADDPCFTAGVKIGVRWLPLSDGRRFPEIYVDDLIDGQWAAPKRNETIVSATIGDGAETQISVEAFGSNKDAYEEVKNALWGIRTVHESRLPGDKVVKASVLEAPIAAGNFYIRRAPWNERYIKQFKEFPNSKHKDYVDATVVALDGLNPYEKRVWPQFQGRHMIDLNLNWERTRSDPHGTLHYIGLWQKEDLSIWCVLALWEAYKGYLFVYDAFMCDECTPYAVIPKLIDRGKLKNYKCEAIVSNTLMWEQKGYVKNISLQYQRELEKRKIKNAKIVEALNYDEYASIVEVGQLFDMNMVFVDSGSKELVLQMMSWVTIDRGKQTGYRPDDKDDGYCRALCIITSELRRKRRWQDIMKPKFLDYNRDTEVMRAHDRAANLVWGK
jgi:predicted phage terminase large subunit-like protein